MRFGCVYNKTYYRRVIRDAPKRVCDISKDMSVMYFFYIVLVELLNTCDYTTNVILLTTQFLYCIFDTLNDLNENVVNCKVVDLVEYYNFDVSFVFIRHC
jgi:hypothetical protein